MGVENFAKIVEFQRVKKHHFAKTFHALETELEDTAAAQTELYLAKGQFLMIAIVVTCFTTLKYFDSHLSLHLTKLLSKIAID